MGLADQFARAIKFQLAEVAVTAPMVRVILTAIHGPGLFVSAALVTRTATAQDSDGHTAEATANIGQVFQFEDAGPSIDVGSLLASGIVDPQIGQWTPTEAVMAQGR